MGILGPRAKLRKRPIWQIDTPFQTSQNHNIFVHFASSLASDYQLSGLHTPMCRTICLSLQRPPGLQGTSGCMNLKDRYVDSYGSTFIRLSMLHQDNSQTY